MVKKIAGGWNGISKRLKSKKGTKLDAQLKYEKNTDNEYFSWKMEFEK